MLQIETEMESISMVSSKFAVRVFDIVHERGLCNAHNRHVALF